MLDAAAALKIAVKLREELVGRRAAVEKAEKYHRGDQPLVFATEEWRTFHADRYKGFADNWCGVVGSAPAERMTITGFRVGDDADPMSPEEKELWAWWERNEGPAQSQQGFLTSTIAKRSFALVWGTPDDEPLLTWEHPSQVLVSYDAENPRIRRYAVKCWSDDDHEFLTLYTPTHVWKFQRKAAQVAIANGRTASGLYVSGTRSVSTGGWEARQPDTDNTWPIEHPLGRVPVVEFANRPPLRGEPLSDIDGAMAMQDAANMLWAYLFSAADFAAMPARVIMGEKPPKMPVLDSEGQKVAEAKVDIARLTKNRMLWLQGEGTKIDSWDSAKLDVFTDVINIAVRHIASQTRTPIYLIHGELGNVNGETLTGLDAPLVAKVKTTRGFHTAGARELFSLMALASNKKDVAQAARAGQVLWSKPEVQSETQIADAAIKDRQAGIPLRTVLEERYGYSQKRIDQIMEQARDEATDPYMALIRDKDAAGV